MDIYSLSFVFLFLPIIFIVCCLTPVRRRSLVILAASAVLYQWLEGDNLLLMAGVVVCDYILAGLMERCEKFKRLRLAIMVSSITKSAVIIVLYSIFHELYGTHVPLGLSVYCLTSAGYVIDCYHGYASFERDPIDFMMMTVFFPKLYAGPLVYYNKMEIQLRAPHISLQRVGEGASVFIRGLAKKIIIGDVTMQLFVMLKDIPLFSATLMSVWVMVLTLAFTLYFELSGLCDMAKGLGLIFGFELPDNFIYPYRATSINDFFARFNVTINRFFRRYVYTSLGGASGSVLSGIFNILLVTILMGLWFGITLNQLVWGVYFAVFVICERYFLRKYMEFIPTLFQWLYSTFVILVSFAFLAGDSLTESFAYLKMMFSFGTASVHDNSAVLYLLSSNYLVLALAAVGSLGAFGFVSDFLQKKAPRLWGIFSSVIDLGLFVVAITFML